MDEIDTVKSIKEWDKIVTPYLKKRIYEEVLFKCGTQMSVQNPATKPFLEDVKKKRNLGNTRVLIIDR